MTNLLVRLFDKVTSRYEQTASSATARRSRQLHEMPGVHAEGLEHYHEPHAAIDHLRRVELGLEHSAWGAAPFSDSTILTPENLSADSELRRRPPSHVTSEEFPDLVHIPIRSIVGISSFDNLGSRDEIATFGDALFAALHGASLVPGSLDYLCSATVKGHGHSHFQEMPQKPEISKVCSKYLARGGMDFTRYGDCYIACQGKQRALIAMFAIWQREGPNGMLRNVKL